MKYYFKLQYTRLIRWFLTIGIHPFIGVAFVLILFIALSKLLFYKTEYANWIYLGIAISLIFNLSGVQRNKELSIIFRKKNYLLLRIIENSLVIAPFQIYLLFEKEFLITLLLVPLLVIFAFIKTNQYWIKTIPTPFKKLPFEFIIGFRKTFWLIGIVYFLIFKAIQVDNYNLGLFGLGILFFISMSYYQKPEPKYYVWVYSYHAKHFLIRKLVTSIICVSILSILAFISILIGFSHNWLTTVLVYLVGCIFLGSMIVAKYSAYPYEMNIPQGIFYALSLPFPPMLLIAIWLFYSQSKKRLEPILEC